MLRSPFIDGITDTACATTWSQSILNMAEYDMTTKQHFDKLVPGAYLRTDKHTSWKFVLTAPRFLHAIDIIMDPGSGHALSSTKRTHGTAEKEALRPFQSCRGLIFTDAALLI